MLSTTLKKLQETVENPGFYKPLTAEEQAELFLALFAPKPKLFEKPQVVRGIDGVSPVKDKDYASKETVEKLVAELSQKTRTELEAIIQGKLATLTPGKDGKEASLLVPATQDL